MSSRPETWLKFAERVSDSIAHDHVATVAAGRLARTSGRISRRRAPVRRVRTGAGKAGHARRVFSCHARGRRLVVVLSQVNTSARPARILPRTRFRCASTSIAKKSSTTTTNLLEGLIAIARSERVKQLRRPPRANVDCDQSPGIFRARVFIGFDPISGAYSSRWRNRTWLPDVPGCGFASLDASPATCPTIAAGRWSHAAERVLGSGDPRSKRRHPVAEIAPRSADAVVAAARGTRRAHCPHASRDAHRDEAPMARRSSKRRCWPIGSKSRARTN